MWTPLYSLGPRCCYAYAKPAVNESVNSTVNMVNKSESAAAQAEGPEAHLDAHPRCISRKEAIRMFKRSE